EEFCLHSHFPQAFADRLSGATGRERPNWTLSSSKADTVKDKIVFGLKGPGLVRCRFRPRVWMGCRQDVKRCSREEDLIPGFSVVTDVNAFHQEEDILSDVGGMI